MAAKRTVAHAAAGGDDEGASKAQLQQRIEETRESISQTVEEIKETVTDQYEAVKETVSDVIGWNEEFSKNPVVWGLGAMSVGLIIGYSIAVVRQDDDKPSSRRRSRSDSPADNFFDGLSRVGMNFVLPAITNKIKDIFGVDLSQQLLGLTSREPERSETPARRRSSAKRSTKKSAQKGVSKKRATKKGGAK
jgi:ElaB/YqjD/DUF883 family membrane-anchored ribosome-binding protein